ncbi:MAG: C1 family peptidase [Cytophagales bacterium]
MYHYLRFTFLKLFLILVATFSSTILAQSKSKGLVFTSKKILDQVDNAKPKLYRGKLPSSYDLSNIMPPPGNQGQMGCCAGWACAYALKTSHEKLERQWALTQNNTLEKTHVFSPTFLYNQVNGGKDQGSCFVDIFELLQKKGCASLSTMPYNDKDYTSQPSAKALSEAAAYKIAWAKNIEPKEIGTIKSYLTQNYPIVIGATVDDNFSNVTAGKIVNSMSTDGGGHAMVVVGYDDTKAGGCFKIMNSWGQDWGDKGFCWMTYETFKKCVQEAWLVEDAKSGAKIDPPKDENNQPVPENSDDAAETFEFEDEVPASIDVDGMETVNEYEGFESYGGGLLLSGKIDIDLDAGSKGQVVIYITKQGNETAYIPCKDELFTDVNNDLVGYTDEFELESWINEYKGEFEVYIPQKFLKAAGQPKLWAVPVLFIDGTDVAHGVPIVVTWF